MQRNKKKGDAGTEKLTSSHPQNNNHMPTQQDVARPRASSVADKVARNLPVAESLRQQKNEPQDEETNCAFQVLALHAARRLTRSSTSQQLHGTQTGPAAVSQSVTNRTSSSNRKNNNQPIGSSNGEPTELPRPGAFRVTPLRREAPLTAPSEGRPYSEHPQGNKKCFRVQIPPNTPPGAQVAVFVGGQNFRFTCPPNLGANRAVHVFLPGPPPQTLRFDVTLPEGVQPGQPLTVSVLGQSMEITVPPNAVPGQRIQHQFALSTLVKNIELTYSTYYHNKYGGGGSHDSTLSWKRKLRAKDLYFDWVETAETCKIKDSAILDQKRATYVRKLSVLLGNDARMPTGNLEFVPVSDAAGVDSDLILNNSRLLLYWDIFKMQSKPLKERKAWFRTLCQKMAPSNKDIEILIRIRRSHLLSDSVDAIMALGPNDMRRPWSFEFVGDCSCRQSSKATMCEWFKLVSEAIFDEACGLWIPSETNAADHDINPKSGSLRPDDYLILFRFFGRLLGRALFDNQRVNGHIVPRIFKHILGWPITPNDTETLSNDEMYLILMKLFNNIADISKICLKFFRTEDHLVPQLREILLGFYDVVPEQTLTIFTPDEMELLVCGIDVKEWQANTTKYGGLFESSGAGHHVVKWFWEVVCDEFDHEMRQRLLYYWTGRLVPLHRIGYPYDEKRYAKFQIRGVDLKFYPIPRHDTSFHRIDLPNYSSKEELSSKLKIVLKPLFRFYHDW